MTNKEYAHEYYEKHKEQLKEASKRYYEAHKEYYKEYYRKYNSTPERKKKSASVQKKIEKREKILKTL